MKNLLVRLGAIFGLLSALFAHGNTFYVDLSSPNPTPPYADWSTAATNIQDAIDASSAGDQILVTNGVYQSGGKAMAGTLTNRVALNKAITVQSVNGPFVTIIEGTGATNGPSAVRCAWLTNNASLVGFTLTAGATQTSGDLYALESGGGVWCASSNALVQNCVIISNTAQYYGGAAYQGSLKNCLASNNRVQTTQNPAIDSATLNNCTVVSNSCVGVVQCNMTNSIVYYNVRLVIGNAGTFSHCCTTPAASGTGNFTNAPLLLADGIHLSSTSPCIGAGTIPASSADIFGVPWATPPSVGCAEATVPFVAQPQIQLIGVPIGFNIGTAQFSGAAPFTFAWLKDGALLQDNGHYSSSQTANLSANGITFADAGNYQLVVSNSFGATTSAVVQVVIHCVDAAGANPTAPYTNWLTAATNIQDAIDAASANEIVLVTNGVYDTGGKVVNGLNGASTNRVVIEKPLALTSVNGYTSTVIEGQRDPVSTYGPDSIRCAWLTNSAILAGFTLRNGSTISGDSGGGAWLSSNSVISDSVLSNNAAGFYGGGVAYGKLFNCFLTGNSAQTGGGAYQAQLNNCTIRGNSCISASQGAGVNSCISRNCIIVENYSSFLFQLGNYPASSIDKFTNCCTSPLPSGGSGNISADPVFLDQTGFHLAPASPCRGAGNALYALGNDLDNEPFGNPPSIGCDEIVDADLTGPLSVALGSSWTHLLVNHSAAFLGTVIGNPSEVQWSFDDGTVTTNFGYVARHTWTNPGPYSVTLTAYNNDNPSGVSTNLQVIVDPLLSPSIQTAGVITNSFQFSFSAQSNANYFVQYATNMTPPISWQTLQSIYFSTNGVINIQDPSVTNQSRFYRILAQ